MTWWPGPAAFGWYTVQGRRAHLYRSRADWLGFPTFECGLRIIPDDKFGIAAPRCSRCLRKEERDDAK